MDILNNESIHGFYDRNAGLIDGGAAQYGTGEITLVPVAEKGTDLVSLQQGRIRAMLDDFTRTVNRGKTLTKDIWTGRLLQGINLSLFGYLGRSQAADPAGDRFPRATELSVSKRFFGRDLFRMISITRNWKVVGSRVAINGELSFSIGGDSAHFFNTLFWLRQFPEEDRCGQHHAAKIANRIFGVFPGETGTRGVRAEWKPEETAVLIRESLKDENTVNRVCGLLQSLKMKTFMTMDTVRRPGARGVELQANSEYGMIERPSLDEIAKIAYRDTRRMFIHKSRRMDGKYEHLTRYDEHELEVEEISAAQEYAREIPSDVMNELEQFMGGMVRTLGTEVPFVLTPELYVISGPVKIYSRSRTEVYTDPVLLLRFEEFPYLLVPISYWLPVSQVNVAEGFGQGQGSGIRVAGQMVN